MTHSSRIELRDLLIEMAIDMDLGNALPEHLQSEYGLDQAAADKITTAMQEFVNDEQDRREAAAALVVDALLRTVKP